MSAATIKPADVLSKLRKLHRRGVPMRYAAVANVDKALADQTIRLFHKFSHVAKAAGIPYQRKSHKHWTRQLVLDSLRELHKRNVPMRSHVIVELDSALRSHAIKFFGSFRQAVERAGIPYVVPQNESRQWTKQRVIMGLRRLHGSGVLMNHSTVHRADSSLAKQTRRYWNSFRDAVEAAGIKFPLVRGVTRQWKDSDLLAALRQLHLQGIPMQWMAVVNADRGLAYTAYKRFGSFRAAVKAANLTYSRGGNGGIQWTRDLVVFRLVERQRGGLELYPSSVRRADLKLYLAAKRFFGSYRLAMQAAGLSYISKRTPTPAPSTPPTHQTVSAPPAIPTWSYPQSHPAESPP